MNKLTDAEKAHSRLAECMKKVFDEIGVQNPTDTDLYVLLGEKIDLINRQKAEIDGQDVEIMRLKHKIDELRADNNYLFETMPHMENEAIKEFAARLIDIAVEKWEHKVDVATIDNLVKEMAGEEVSSIQDKEMLKPRIKQKFNNVGYVSPIEVLEINIPTIDEGFMKMSKQIANQQERIVFEAIKHYEVKVDKDELIRALKYDRKQYSKGYADAIQQLREKCIEHQDFHKGDDGVFRGWISIEDLDEIIYELFSNE